MLPPCSNQDLPAWTPVIEIAALDELKAEVEFLWQANKTQREYYDQNLELTACLRDMVGALARTTYELDKITDGFCEDGERRDLAIEAFRFGDTILAKHADLIGKLNPRKLGSE